MRWDFDCAVFYTGFLTGFTVFLGAWFAFYINSLSVVSPVHEQIGIPSRRGVQLPRLLCVPLFPFSDTKVRRILVPDSPLD